MGFMERLAEIERNYLDLERQLAQPEVYGDRQRYAELARSHAQRGEVMGALRE